MKIVALISMLHEPSESHSGVRTFRGDPVLAYTLRRLARCEAVDSVAIATWNDQVEAVSAFAGAGSIRSQGVRRLVPSLESVAVAQKWSDGWRGGLLATCAFDRGFDAQLTRRIMTESEADAAVLIDPAAGLIDPGMIDRLIRAARDGSRDCYFIQAPPGLSSVLLKRAMADRLIEGNTHPGRIVHYLPEAPVLDPVTSDACLAVPLSVSRSTDRLLLDSDRQCHRIAAATESLNGTLVSSDAESILSRLAGAPSCGIFPRDLTVELTPRRTTRPVFAAGTHLPIARGDMTLDHIARIVEEASRHDDARICLAGVGDPLLHPQFVEIVERCTGLRAVSIETDLLDLTDEALAAILKANVDVISVHIPAMSPGIYERVMGVNRLTDAVNNIKRLLVARQSTGRLTPLIVPTFMKLADNLDEMEQWYDTWLRALGTAVIGWPSTCAGQIPDGSAADITPPLRKSCRRIDSRLTILSDGAIVACEEDALGRFPLGNIGTNDIGSVWTARMRPLREAHQTRTALPVLCQSCKDWHRP